MKTFRRLCFKVFVFVSISFFIYSISSNVSNKLVYKSSCDCKHDYVELETNRDRYSVRVVNKNKNSIDYAYNITFEQANELNFTCDAYNVLKRGPKQKVISYSLFGTGRNYYDKLKSLAKQVKKFYPGWIIRVYYDQSIDKSIICQVECEKDENGELLDNADFCNVNKINLKLNKSEKSSILNGSYLDGTKWRWLPIGDSFVDVFSSRDIDSFIIQREADSVNAWLNSEKDGHIMRDHYVHGVPMLAGMWGLKTYTNRSLARKIFNDILNVYNSSIENRDIPKGVDQDFLKHYVYSLIKNNSLIHDSFTCAIFDGTAFPSKRVGNCFIGSTDGCDAGSKFPDCPIECRPKQHLDWYQC